MAPWAYLFLKALRPKIDIFFNRKTYIYVWPKYLTSCLIFPFGLAGDEGQALGGTYMAFHWQPDLSPVLKNAGLSLSRFMITTIPSTFYVSWSAIFVDGEFLKFPFCDVDPTCLE